MAGTRTFNVNSSTYTAVTVQTVCSECETGEDAQASTTDYYISATGSDSDRVTYPAGKKKKFTRPLGKFFYPGDTPGYIKTAAGSLTFTQEEQ